MSDKAALYVRVSTTAQDLTGQRRELETFAHLRGWEVVEIYSERISATGRVERKEYDRLLRDARNPDRPWSHLAVWALDRFSRAERFTQAIDAIFDLEKVGVAFHSMKEPFLDTPTRGERNLGRELLLGICPTIASFESIRRGERVRIAMEEIRQGRRPTRSGKPPGRPWRVTAEKASQILRLRSLAPPRLYAEIAQRVGLPVGTCRRVASQLRRGQDPFQTRSAHKGPAVNEGGRAVSIGPLRSGGNT